MNFGIGDDRSSKYTSSLWLDKYEFRQTAAWTMREKDKIYQNSQETMF